MTVGPADVQGVVGVSMDACVMRRDAVSRLGIRAGDHYKRRLSVERGVLQSEALLERAAGTRRQR